MFLQQQFQHGLAVEMTDLRRFSNEQWTEAKLLQQAQSSHLISATASL